MRLENWLYTIPLRLRSLLVRHRQNQDLDEELRDHIERQTRENQSRGMGEEEARFAALRTFGNLVVVREQTHETWAWATIGRLWQDFRRALRSARRAPLLTGVAVLALALGIGLNTGVFAIVNAMFLRVPTRVDPASFAQICPQYTGGSQDLTRTLPLRQKTTMPFAAARTPSARWRHGDNIPHFLNRETGTSAHC
jgi:hypothetical protein